MIMMMIFIISDYISVHTDHAIDKQISSADWSYLQYCWYLCYSFLAGVRSCACWLNCIDTLFIKIHSSDETHLTFFVIMDSVKYFLQIFHFHTHVLVVQIMTDCCAVVDSVLYISIHRGDIFPAGNLSCADKVGSGQGTGFNINIPWIKVHFVHLVWCILTLKLWYG